MDVRIDCYYGVLEKYKRRHPHAHFELIMRKDFNHILSPSWELVKRYETGSGWEQYKIDFMHEIYSNPLALENLVALKEMASKKTLFLVCFEKSPLQCHRRLVKWLLEHMEGDTLPPLEETLEIMRTQLKGNSGINSFLS